MPTTPSEPVLYDVLVIGAGPAGLAAATTAAGLGAHVALLDAAARPGGQYWRHRAGDDGRLHHDWGKFRALRTSLDAAVADGRIAYLSDHPCWHLERVPNLAPAGSASTAATPAIPATADAAVFIAHVVHAGADTEVRARTVVLATGAYDRQLPFPGWTLPGVITAGGAQALLKGQGVVAGKRIVVAGTGPFLFPVAVGLLHAGAEVAGVYEAGSPTAMLRHPVTAARNASKLIEGAGYMATLLRNRVPYRTRRTVIAAHGETEVTGVTTAALDAEWRVIPGTEEQVACDTVATGYGFTPQVELAADLGCAMAMDADGSLAVTADETGRSSVDGAFVAGEARGVGGSALAVVDGRIAGLHAAASVTGAQVPPARLKTLARLRAPLRAFADLLPVAFPVKPGWRTWVHDDTTVCRCEEVPATALRDAVTEMGAEDARSAKLFARAGMGLCQGRVCGYAASGLVAQACGREVTADDLHSTIRRPIAWPVTLGALAAGNPDGPIGAPGSNPR